MKNNFCLSLIGKNSEDIEFISSLFQDAIIFNADIEFDSKNQIFYLVANRFCKKKKNKKKEIYRVISGLKIFNANSVRTIGFDKNKKQFLNLLTIDLEKNKKNINFVFSKNINIKVNVKKIDLIVRDFSTPHPSFSVPEH